jgi:rhomboid family GlyGly-CTERM serine protease
MPDRGHVLCEDRRLDLPWRSLLLALSALIVYAITGPLPQALVLDRSAALAAQPWTLITAHLVHTGGDHLLWDVLGLLLVGLVFEPLLRGRLWLVLAVGPLAIDGLVLSGLAGFERYAGLSGLINAVAGAGLVQALRAGDRLAAGFGLLVVGKVLFETFTGGTLLTNTAWPPALSAHILGLMSGAVTALLVGPSEPTRVGPALR